MATPPSPLRRLPLAISCAVSLFFVLAASTKISGQNSGPARPVKIIGTMDGISYDGDQSFIAGWTCQQGQKKAIGVRIFDDKRIYLTAGMANLFSEPAVQTACQDHDGGIHRFFIVLPIGFDRNKTLQVEGFIPGGTERGPLGGSQTRLRVIPHLDAPFAPPALPILSGTYRSLAEHPRVFTTAEELKEAAQRTKRPGSYSKDRFGQLAGRVAQDLSADWGWDATYSGCVGLVYQHMLSVERTGGDDDAITEMIRSAVQLKPDSKVRKGVFVIAARLAMYAALVKGGAAAPPGAPNPDQAAVLAKRILLAWADHGFPRDAQGHFLRVPAISCEQSGKVTLLAASGPALYLGGIQNSVHAQDLLQYLGVLDAGELNRLNLFHSAMFDLIREAENVKFGYGGIPFPAPPIARFNNVDSGALSGLLAIARLQDDKHKLNAVLYGGDPSIPILLSWMRLFNRAIYGENDKPLECVPIYRESDNPLECSSPANDPTHWPYFQTANVAPGEVVDRLRNEHIGNSFGYAVGNLGSLIRAAEILRIAGFDPYGYRGDHQQSIEMAIQYYSCFGKEPGFYRNVWHESSCPNAMQYYGKLVNDVDRPVIFGAYRFPKNNSISQLDAAAKSASKPFLVDTTVFGRWRD